MPKATFATRSNTAARRTVKGHVVGGTKYQTTELLLKDSPADPVNTFLT